MRADEVYAILKGKLVKLTEDIKSMGDWKPIQHKGTVQTADDLPTDAKEGWMYNIATDSIYGAAGMNVVMTSEGWDPMGPIINMGPYLTKEEGNKTFQPKGNYLSGTDSDLKESGKAADAKVTGEKIAKNSSDITKKLDKNQGVENSGKIAGINESGDIVPIFPVGVDYNSETNCLEFGSDQKMELNQGIGLDSTLTKTGSAADAGATGKEIASLKEDLSNKITKFYASNQGETHITDSDNGKIQDMMIYGESSQDGMPSPENPVEIKSVVNPTVKVCGKNLLNATLQTTIVNGVTCTANGDGTYTLNGTATTITTFDIAQDVSCSSFRLVGCPVGGAHDASYELQARTNNLIYGYDTGDGKNIKADENFFIRIRINAGINCNNLLFKPMIVDASLYPDATYDDFEPYHKQTVTLPYTLNAIPVSSGGNVTIDGQQYVSDYVDVERGKLVKMVDSSKLDNTQSIVGKTEWLLAEPQETDLTKEEIAAFKALATYYPTTNISVNSEQLDGYTVFNYPISMANIITSLKTKTENLESANYTDRGTLADTDAFLINDGTGMKKDVLSELSDFVLDKIADKVFAKLQTNDKTILGALNELNSNSFSIYKKDVSDLDNPPSAFILNTGVNPKGLPGLGSNGCCVIQHNPGSKVYSAQLAFSFGSDKIAIRRKRDADWTNWTYFSAQ